MKFSCFVLFLSVLGATVAPAFQQQAQPAAKKKVVTPKKTPPAKTASVANKPAATKTGTTVATAKKRTLVSTKTSARKAPVRTASVARQAQPSSDRYKEIQQALASKGYLKSEPSGVWDADSVAAMRQFQTDRNLDPSGKLTAAALIDLGLGPKPESRESINAPSEAVPEPPKIETAPPPQP